MAKQVNINVNPLEGKVDPPVTSQNFDKQTFIESPGTYAKGPNMEDYMNALDQKSFDIQQRLKSLGAGDLIASEGYGIQDFIPAGHAPTTYTEYQNAYDPTHEPHAYTKSQLAKNELFNTIATTPSYARNEFKFAAPMRFGADYRHYNVQRYATLDEFNEYGFSPFRDNEKYYEDRISGWSDFHRARQGFADNFSIGWDSYWGSWGSTDAYVDTERAERLAKTAATYNSRRGTNLAIVGNSISQSGLGLGMAAGLATEFAITELATLGTGGWVGLGRGLARIPKAVRGLTKLENLSKMTVNLGKSVKNFAQFKNIYKAPKWVGKQLIPNTAKGWANAYKGIKAEQGFSMIKGIGNAYKDYRIANMAMSEAAIEGGLVYNEIETDLYNKFLKEHDGREPTQAEYKELQRISNLAAIDAYNKNFLIIYGSNLFTFNRLFNGFGSTLRKKLGPAVLTRNAAGKLVFDPKKGIKLIESGIKGIPQSLGVAKNVLLTPRAWGRGLYTLGKGGINYAKVNVVEGLQELGQEVIADAAKDYYTNIYTTEKGNATVGDWYRLSFKHFDKYKSHQGYEIFMSGFLMGGITMLPQKGVSAGYEMAVKLGVGGKTTAWTSAIPSKQQYKEYMDAKRDELQNLQNSFKNVSEDNPHIYFSGHLEDLITQQKVHQDMEAAAEIGDKKSWLGHKEDADFSYVRAVMDTGAFDHLLNTLESKKEMDVADFNEAYGADVTTKEEQAEVIDNWVNNAKLIEKSYKEVQRNNPNPYNPNLYQKGTDQYMTEFFKYQAHEKYIESYAAAKYKLESAVERKKQLFDKLKSEPWYRFKGKSGQGLEKKIGVTGQDINALLDPIIMQGEIETLRLEIQELIDRKNTNSLEKGEAEILKYKQKLFDQFNTYNDARKRYKYAVGDKTLVHDKEKNQVGRYTPEQIAEQEDALKELQKAWVNTLKLMADIEGQTIFDEDIEASFLEVKDGIELDDDITEFGKMINYLASPKNYADFMLRNTRANMKVWQNRMEVFMKHLNASFVRQENSAFETILYKEGFIITPRGRQQLFDEGVVPTEFIRVNDMTSVTPESPEYATPKQLVLDWLEEVRGEGSGMTREEYDKSQKAKQEEEEIELEEAEEKEKGPKKISLKDNAGNSNYDSWANITRVNENGEVVNLQDEANEIFEKAQEKQEKLGQGFSSIDEWIEKGANDDLQVLIGKYNAYREAEFKKTEAEKQKKKEEAEESKKKRDELTPLELALEQEKEALAREEASEFRSQELVDMHKANIEKLEKEVAEDNLKRKKAEAQPTSDIKAKIADIERRRQEKLNSITTEIEKVEKEIDEIEKNNKTQGAYDFSARSNSGKWNSANTELFILTQENNRAFSIYKLLIGNWKSFKEIVDKINEKTGLNIEYTERMQRADNMSAEEIQSAIDSYNKSSETSKENKANVEKEILKENNLEDEKEYLASELVEKFPLTGVQKVIWNLIKHVVNELGIKVKFSSSRIIEGFDGIYNPTTGEILIRPSTLKNGRFGEVLVHEVVHALTTKIISRVNSGVTTGLTQKQINAVKGLMKLFEAVKADNTLENKYPVKDVLEFIAHLTNDAFVKELESKDKSFLQKVVDFIFDILGITNANELAKKYLKDIISDGTFLQEQGVTVLPSDYGSNIQGSKEQNTKLQELKNKLQELKQQLSEINAKYDAEYVDAVKKGEMTKEQAMRALEEAGRKDSKAYAEIAALESKPTEEVVTDGQVRSEETSSKPYFVPQGNTILEKVNSVIDQIIKNQELVKKFSDLTAAELKKYNIKEGSHGYLVNVGTKKKPNWVKATSVTQVLGTTFEMDSGTLVELSDGRVGVIVEGPVENQDRIINKEDPRQDTYSIKINETDEVVEATRNQLKNLDFIDSSIAGTTVDSIVRDFFLGRIASDAKAPKGINPKAYRALLDSLQIAKKTFDKDNLHVLANNIILFDANAPGGVIAGEIDLLVYSAETGRFYIYDMKTARKKFWAIDPKAKTLKSAKLSPSFAETVYENVRGVARTKKKGYEIQQSIYKNLFEKQYGTRIGTNADSGINLLPYNISYDKQGNIETLTAESTINLLYAPEVSQWVDTVDPSFKGKVLEEGTGRAAQPEQFKGAAWKDTGKPYDAKFDNKHTSSILNGKKSSTLRSQRTLPGHLTSKLGSVKTIINGKPYRFVSLGVVTVGQAAAELVKIAREAKAMHEDYRASGKPGVLKTRVRMTEEMADAIIKLSERDDIIASDKEKLIVVTSEGLPTTKPARWSENPITIKNRTYYASSPGTIKWLNDTTGKWQMVMLNIFPERTVEITPEMTEETANIYNAFAEKVKVAEETDSNGKLLIRNEIRTWMDEKIANNEYPSGVEELKEALEQREKELINKEFASFADATKGTILTINSDHITNFGETVVVMNKGGNYVTVYNPNDPSITTTKDGKNKTIKKSEFAEIVDSVGTKETMEVKVTQEEETTTNENVENSKTLSVEERKAAIEKNKDSSSDDILKQLKENIKKNCE